MTVNRHYLKELNCFITENAGFHTGDGEKYPEMGPEQAIGQMEMKVAFLDVGRYGDHSDNTGLD